MKHLQKLLLLVLLVTCLPAKAHFPCSQVKRAARTRSTPYVAYLQGKNGRVCGGFLVAPNWVMTAAQCAAYKPLTVILGARTMQRKENSWQTFEVQEYHCHPAFNSPRDGNDILLLKLKSNATCNSYVQTINFEKSKIPDGTVCSTVGWGGKTPTATVHEASVTIVKQRECLRRYPFLADNLICGHSGSAEKSDAGDPLVCNNKAYGVFSYKHGTWPGFYTRIAPYLSWIYKVMKAK